MCRRSLRSPCGQFLHDSNHKQMLPPPPRQSRGSPSLTSCSISTMKVSLNAARKRRRSTSIDRRPPLRNRSKSRAKTNRRTKKRSKRSYWRDCATSPVDKVARCSVRNLAFGRPGVGGRDRASSRCDLFEFAGEVNRLPRHYQCVAL